MIRINYKSDFKIREQGFPDSPFKYVFQINGSGRSFIASFDGINFQNCGRSSSGDLMIYFNDHRLKTGVLVVTRSFYLSDQDFEDGICEQVDTRPTGFILVNGASDLIDKTLIPVPFYQKGEKGDSFKYSDFTPAQLEDLKHNEINGGNA